MTQTFNNFAEAYISTLSLLLDCGHQSLSRTGNMLELIGHTVRIMSIEQVPIPLKRKLDKDFAISFARSITNGDATADNVSNMPERAKQFLRVPANAELPDNFSVMYGPRYNAQISNVLAELDRHPHSRRAIITVLDADDWAIANNPSLSHLEFSCTLAWQFFIRDNRLNMHTFMRSQSALRIWPIDTVIASAVQKDVLARLRECMPDLQLGSYSVNFGSLHVFDSELDWAQDTLAGANNVEIFEV